MSEPIFRDAVEDEDHENFDPSAMYEYLDSQHKVVANEEVRDEETEKMLEEIVQLTIAEEVERFPWREPTIGGSNLADRYSISRILELDYSDGNPSILARMAKEAARVIQFPENTAYLHGLGLFSSATVINFQVEYSHKFIPTGMYTLGAQPSGSGKSSAHGYFLDPIAHALKKRYRDVAMFHANINGEIEITQKQADKAKTDYAMIREYAGRIQMMENEKLSRPLVDAPKKNTTPQAAEEVASKQGGVINVCSDEAEALDTYLGLSYSDGKTNPDNGVFIAAFGGDMMGTARISREGISTNVRGAFAVIAQNQSVDTMIRAGAAGRGVSERCLIIKEPNRIGYRTFTRERSMFDVDLKAEYQALCESVVNGVYPISLTFSEECRDMIVDLKNDIEPQCRPGAKYGDQQIRGFASKIEQHIAKLAGNFHIAEQWNPLVTRTPNKEIQVHNLSKAMIVCMDLLDSYKALIENESSMSASKLVLEVIGHMKGYALKGVKAFPVDKLRLSVMKEAWYGAIEGKKVDFLINLLSRCEEMNFCHVKEIGRDKKSWQVLINPALRNFTIAMGD